MMEVRNSISFLEKLIIANLFVFFLMNKSYSQSINFSSDSLKIEELTDGMDKFYQNPLQFKQNLPLALELLNATLKEQPESNYLLRKKIEVLHYYFYFARRTYKSDQIINYLHDELFLRNKLGDSCNNYLTFRHFSSFWKQKRNYQKALFYSDEALSSAIKCNNQENIQLSELSKIQAEYLNDFNSKVIKERALKKLKNILKKAQKSDNSRSVIIACNQITEIYLKDKVYDSVGRYLTIGKEVSLLNDDVISLKNIYRKLGTYYKRGENNLSKALPYYRKSVQINEQLNDSIGLIKAYLGLSNTLAQIGKYEESLSYYKKYRRLEKKR